MADGEDAPSDSYELTKGRMTIQESPEVGAGTIHVVDEEEAKWNADDEPGLIQLTAYMPTDQMQRFLTKLADAPSEAEVIAHLYVLTFRSEMDRALAEPYHPQTYFFDQKDFSPILLSSIAIKQSRVGAAQGEEAVAPDAASTPAEAGSVQVKTAKPSPAYRPIVTALWAIVGVLVLILLKH